MTNNELKPLTSPWTLLRDIASWLPAKDEAIATRQIERHQQRHAEAKLAEYFQDATEGLQRPQGRAVNRSAGSRS